MEHTLVAVFDNETRAQEALNELLACGISREDLYINAASRGDLSLGTATGTAQETSAQAAPHDESLGDKIKSFFSNLFGSDNEAEAQSNMYAEAARRGNYVLTVRVEDERQMSRATDVINQYNPIDIEEHAAEWRSSGWSPEGDFASSPRTSGYAAGSEGFDSAQTLDQESDIEREREIAARQTGADLESDIGQEREAQNEREFDTRQTGFADTRGATETKAVPVVEEQLRVGKRVVQRGGVRVVQHITEQPVQESIPLHGERVTVERHRIDQPAGADAAAGLKESVIEVRETVEEPVVQKTARVVEEVVVKKEAFDRTETVEDTLRRADVEVEPLGGQQAAMQAEPALDDSAFRTHWQQSFSQAGGRYEDYAPAYSYGYTLHGSNEYRGRTWEEVEPQIRADWEAKHADSPWERAKDAVRVGWERMTS
jgi:uncharacterized protein (TIGR02271 family)